MSLRYVFALLLCSQSVWAQKDVQPFAGAGYAIENRIGFHGAVAQAGISWHFSEHLSGIAGADYFYGWSVPGWDSRQNAGAYFRQFTPSIRLEYNTGATPGTGLILLGGIALRKGETYHFETGLYHNGSFTDHVYVTEKVRGSGLVLGAGYGFPMRNGMLGRIEFNNQAFLMLNDQYTLMFKVFF